MMEPESAQASPPEVETAAPEPGPWNPFVDFLPKWLLARAKKSRVGAHKHARDAEQRRRSRRLMARASRRRNR